jgi:hypothetical protein
MRRAPCFAGALRAVALNAQGQVQRLAEAAGQHRRLQSRPLAHSPSRPLALTPPSRKLSQVASLFLFFFAPFLKKK